MGILTLKYLFSGTFYNQRQQKSCCSNTWITMKYAMPWISVYFARPKRKVKTPENIIPSDRK